MASERRVLPTPRAVDIAVTGRCNLSCAYCFYADEMVARRDLPTSTWLRFFAELGRLGVMQACLTGGEPFARPDFFELLDGLVANRLRYQILSNGTLLDDATLARFEVGKRRLRLDSIQVSVDGSRAEVHDRSRPESFHRVMKGLRLLVEARFPVSVRVTVNRHNVDDLENIAKLLLEELGLPGFGTNEAFSCGATNRSEGGIRLSPTERRRAMATLTRLAAEYPGRITAQAGPLALARELEQVDQALAAGRSSATGRGSLSACGGVFNKMAVLHDGTLVPCHNLSQLHLGRVGESDLQEVWLHHEQMNALRRRQEVALSSLKTCSDCRYRGFCTGGCPAGAILATGGLTARNPADCYRVLRGEDPMYDLQVESRLEEEGRERAQDHDG